MSCVTRRRPPLSPKFDHVGVGQSQVGQQHHHPGLASFLPTFFYGNAVDRTPIISGGCARAASGHAAAAPPRSAMKLRRLMQNCPSRTSLPKGSVVRHSKIGPPMTLWLFSLSCEPPLIRSSSTTLSSDARAVVSDSIGRAVEVI